jgi:hypothetical protein
MILIRILTLCLVATPVWSLSEQELDQHIQALNKKYKNIEIVLSIVDHRPGEGTTESQVTLTWNVPGHKINGTRSNLLRRRTQENVAPPTKQLSPFTTEIGENAAPRSEFGEDRVRKRKYVLNDIYAWSLSNQPFRDSEVWNGRKWFRNDAEVLTQGSTYGRQMEDDLFLPELHMSFDFYHQLGDLYDTVYMFGQRFAQRKIESADVENQWWVTYLFRHPVGQVKYKYLIEAKDTLRILETHQSIYLPDEGEVPMLSITNSWSSTDHRFDFPEKIVVQHLIDTNLIARTVTINVMGVIINQELNASAFRFDPALGSKVVDLTLPKSP